MMMQLPCFKEGCKNYNSYYDVREDWALIESSFATQYNMKRKEISLLSYDEFSTLLQGIMPETPLGQIVSIRAEKDPDTIKRFNSTQKAIYNNWQNKMLNLKTPEQTDKDLELLIKKLEKLFG